MSGHTAVVVGASGAIGAVLTSRLLEEGWRVVAVGRSRASLERLERSVAGERSVGERSSGQLVPCTVDITSDDAPASIAAAVGDPIDLLVHAASAPLGGHVLSVEPAAVRAALEVKVVAWLRLVVGLRDRFATPSRIVAVGGSLGFDPVAEGSTAGVANAAQANLVRMLNQALAGDGITVHTVAPGPVLTPRFRDLAATQAASRGINVQQVIDEAAAANATGALTTPEQVAWAILRLTEPEAAALAGGAFILDGGRRTALP